MAHAYSRIDVAIQILMYVGWKLGCAMPQLFNIERLTPNENKEDRIAVGGPADAETGTEQIGKLGGDPTGSFVSVSTGCSVIYEAGLTVSIIYQYGSIRGRNVFAQGRVIAGHRPIDLKVTSIIYSTRYLNGWIRDGAKGARGGSQGGELNKRMVK